MRKLLIGAAVAGAAFAAMPAAAQYSGYDRGYGYESQRGGRTFDAELGRIAQRIRMLASQRRVSPREADRLLHEVGQIDRLSDRYRRNGVTPWEHRDLQQRLAQLRERSRFAMAGGGWNERRSDDGRWNADGANGGWDRDEYEDDERWDRDDDEDGDRWDRDDDEDGERWDDRPNA